MLGMCGGHKLQALVYILPSTTAVFSYAIGSRKLSAEGADRVAGQLRGDKECACPFSGVTKSGRVWRKVPESDAQSVGLTKTG